MHAKEERIFEAYQRAKAFLDGYPAIDTTGLSYAKAMLDDAVSQLAELTELAAAHGSGDAGTRADVRFDIVQQLRRGRRALDLLDAIVPMAFGDNEGACTQWRAAKRIHSVAVFFVSEPAAGAQARSSEVDQASAA